MRSSPRPQPKLRQATRSKRYRLIACLALMVFGVGPFLALAASPHQDSEQTSHAAQDADNEQNPAAVAARLEREFQATISHLVTATCLDCHSGEAAEAGVDLAQLSSLSSVADRPQRFEKVLKMVEAGAMPPPDYATISVEEREGLIRWLNEALDHAAAQLPPEVDRPTIRRLNRAEYDNTIRDLFGLELSVAKDFPSDEVGYGFDNIGDVLSVSPLHMERYLEAAESVAAAAINAEAYDPFSRTFEATEFESDIGGSVDRRGNYHLSRRGEVFVELEIPVEAEYLIHVEASADQAGDELAKMEISAGAEKLTTIEVGGRNRVRPYELRATLPAGKSRIAAAFINDYYNPDAENERDRDRNLQVRQISLERVSEPQAESLPQFHRQLIPRRLAEDADSDQVLAAAREQLAPFATLAFRRPVSAEELDRYVPFVARAVKAGESFERGMQVAITAILVSPHFLFHIEGEPGNAANTGSQVAEPAISTFDEYALASRLSYFLWSSMPDEELFALAAAGTLHEPEVLESQVRRMLSDPRSQALVKNFASQWLNLRRLDEIAPTDESIPGLDSELKSAMSQETELFFAWVLSDNRSLVDLLDAPVTFVNARLAEHYGLPGVEGDEFRQVDLSATTRRGLLSQASILTITSNPTRTSPVKRGKWILENILGDAPPEPPPNVPPLEEVAASNPQLPLRDQLLAHRADAVCNSCHQLMDELGFGFESFGPLGETREQDEQGRAVADTGKLPSGETFAGASELISLLKTQRRQDFARCFTEKMFTFALGRGVTRRDRATIDAIMERAEQDDYRLVRVITEIVTSEPFAGAALTGGIQP